MSAIIEHESKRTPDALVYDGDWNLIASNVEVDYIDGIAWIDTTVDAEVATAMALAADRKSRQAYVIIPTGTGRRCYTLRQWKIRKDDGCSLCRCKHVGFHAAFDIFYDRYAAA